MTVKPVGPRLSDRKFVGESLPRLDTRKTDPRNAILFVRQNQTMPVNRGHLIQVVSHLDGNLFTFLEPHNRPWGFTIVTNTFLNEVAGIDLYSIDSQAVFTRQTNSRQEQAQCAY